MMTRLHGPLAFISEAPGNKVGCSEKILAIRLIVKHGGSLESVHSDFYLNEQFFYSELPIRMFKQLLRASHCTLVAGPCC